MTTFSTTKFAIVAGRRRSKITSMLQKFSSALLHDDTFRRLCRARDLLASEFQSQIPLERAAKEACLSPFHFHRLFRSTFGETPHDFLTRRRMDRAMRLLAAGEMTVTEICVEVGYSSLGSFSSKFQLLAGRTPTQYQREARCVFGYMRPWNIILVPACYFSAYSG
ncbi:MAG TPA: AraC family transcriptional regulator [Candidatus Angelobacter sp.]|nr:AraC family transcriptional regulator [Candidatus Angelobacter sp.]